MSLQDVIPKLGNGIGDLISDRDKRFELVYDGFAERHGSYELTYVWHDESLSLHRYLICSFIAFNEDDKNSALSVVYFQVWVGADDGSRFTRRLVGSSHTSLDYVWRVADQLVPRALDLARALRAEDLQDAFIVRSPETA